MNKTAVSAAQLVKCVLLHAYSRTITTVVFSCTRTNKNFMQLL